MKLIINKTDIISAFVAKTGFEAREIEIDMQGELGYVPHNKINLEKPELPATDNPYARVETAKSIHNCDVRMAIATIFDEGYNVCKDFRDGSNVYPNKISLIKAIRVVVPNTGLKDAKDYVENVLLKDYNL
jgi:ribosomal protein L7/L12